MTPEIEAARQTCNNYESQLNQLTYELATEDGSDPQRKAKQADYLRLTAEYEVAAEKFIAMAKAYEAARYRRWRIQHHIISGVLIAALGAMGIWAYNAPPIPVDSVDHHELRICGADL